MDVALHVNASPLAGTVRYRVEVLARALRSEHYKVYCGPVYRDASVHFFFKHFGKHLSEIDRLGGVKIFDVTDNHFEGQYAEFYRQMLDRCDVVTVNSSEMKTLVSDFNEKAYPIHVIDDPYLTSNAGGLENPSVSLAEGIKRASALFFGHASNFDALRHWVDTGADKVLGLPIAVCSNMVPKGVPLTGGFTPFSVGNLNKCFLEAKVGLVLSSKPWSSANRILDCLVRGIPAVATDTNANIEVAGHLKESVRWVPESPLFDFKAAYEELKNQDFSRYSELSIQQKWLSLVNSVLQ